MINSLGRKEMHDMPKTQIEQLSKPSFSISVPPRNALPAPYNSNGVPVTPPAGYQQQYPPNAAGTYGPTSMNAMPGAGAAYTTSSSTTSSYSTGLGASAYRSSSSTTTFAAPGASAAPGAASGSAAPLDSGTGSVDRPHF